MMKPLPTTAQAYSIVLHEETQRGVHSGNQVNGTTDSTAFNTNSQRWNNDRGNSEYKGNNQTLNQYANIDTRRNNSFCSYCKKQGHVKEKCYKLVGYPQSFKFNKPKRGYGNGQVNASMTEDEKNGNNTPGGMTSQGFTSDQCEKLIQMLQTVQTRNLGTSGSEPNASGNCVGKCSITDIFDYYFTTLGSNLWIIDSGASQHMTHEKNLLHNMRQLDHPILVRLPKSFKVKVFQIGSVILNSDIELHDVLYVPSFKHNLLSINQLCKQLDCDVIFNKNACILQVLSLKMQVVFGRAVGGLYVLDETCAKSQSSESFFVSVKSLVSKNRVSSLDIESDSQALLSRQSTVNGEPPSQFNNNIVSNVSVSTKLWHFRLGHLPYHAMKNIKELSLKPNDKHDFPCDVCPMARQSKLPFQTSVISSKKIFELIHIDTWGPYNVPTYKGERYFLTIVDDFSRATWTYLLSTKSSVFPTLKSFLSLIERQFSAKVKIIRSDNAYELGAGIHLSEFFSSKGIIHQTSCVGTPQQNGVVERKHRHLLETCRALLYQSHLPKKFWGIVS